MTLLLTNTKTPSVFPKIGISLRKAADIAVGESVIKHDVEAEGKAKWFIKLLESQWHACASCCVPSSWPELSPREVVPLTKDVMMFQEFLQDAGEQAQKELEEGPGMAAWTKLSQVLLSEITLFNGRPEGEVAEMLLETYINRNKIPVSTKGYDFLTALEQQLARNFSVIEIQGKCSRKVPLLLTDSMLALMDVLKNTRDKVRVRQSNPYFFANLQAGSRFQGGECLRSYALESKAKCPDDLTTPKLRKPVATLCQMSSLKDKELDQVAESLGHDVRAHRKEDRLSENKSRLKKISEIFLAMDEGKFPAEGK